MNTEEARSLLKAANLFYDADIEDGDDPSLSQTINLSDVWCWACADGEYVRDEELVEVAQLFWEYGFAGILYWVSEKNGGRKSTFDQNNRLIDFVRREKRP